MPSVNQLKTEITHHQRIRSDLLAAWPDIDEETLADMLEGITDLHEMIATAIRSALVDEALQVGLRTRLVDMKSRLSRLEQRGAKKRQLALEAMTEAGLKKLEQPLAKDLTPHTTRRRLSSGSIQLEEPDIRATAPKGQANLQSLAVATSRRACEDQSFINAVSDLQLDEKL